MKFKKVASGEWVQPIRRGYLMHRCDCGLIHRLNFRLLKRGDRRWIQFQAFRHEQEKGPAPLKDAKSVR